MRKREEGYEKKRLMIEKRQKIEKKQRQVGREGGWRAAPAGAGHCGTARHLLAPRAPPPTRARGARHFFG